MSVLGLVLVLVSGAGAIPQAATPASAAPAATASPTAVPAATAALAPTRDVVAPPDTPDPARPVVLLLHGRGFNGADTTRLRSAWQAALNRGLEAAGAGPVLAEDDLRLVWYADALDPREGAACERRRDPAAGAHDGAARATVELTSALGVAGSLMSAAADLIGGHEGDALRAISGDLLYLGDTERRCHAETRLADALARAAAEGRPVILVAHSFGSLLAYHHLHRRSDPAAAPVERLVTIGALIGRPELRELLVGAEGRRTGLPPGVASWVNVRDPDDPFAAALSGVRDDDAVPPRVRDVRTERIAAGDPHDAGRYLADPATGRAVREAWESAAAGAGSAGATVSDGPRASAHAARPASPGSGAVRR